jgi:hypothetical protein
VWWYFWGWDAGDNNNNKRAGDRRAGDRMGSKHVYVITMGATVFGGTYITFRMIFGRMRKK